MATKIRLQRHGRKGKPFFHIVVADARAKRDGRNIEKLGTYNPNTNPATIELNFDSAVQWVVNGAEPSDTARAILSYKGVLMKKHLLDGVRKDAHTEDEAEKKFEAWLDGKTQNVQGKKDTLAKNAADAKSKALDAETEVNKARAAALAPAPVVVEEAPVAEVTEEAPAAVEAATEEAPATEAAVEEVPAADASEEAPAKEA